MRVYAAIASELARRGVRAVFSLPAGEIVHILIEAEARDVAVYRTRHEHGAIGMADGYARLSGQLGVALVGQGPGLTNGINALVTARKAGSPVLLIAGEQFQPTTTDLAATYGRTAGKKSIDQTGFLAALGIPSVVLTSAASAAADVAAAMDIAQHSGAFAVLIPEDVVQGEAGDAAPRVELTTRRQAPPTPIAPDQIAAVADLLDEAWAASRPVILAGRGAVASGAQADLRRIGDAVGALYATSLGAKGLFAGDPWDLGVAGTMSAPGASELLARSDIVLAFGASLGPFTTMAGDLFRNARMIRVDTDPGAVRGASENGIPIVGDAGLVAAQVAAELARRGVRRSGYRTAYAAGRLAEDRTAPLAPGPDDPGALLGELDRLLPSPRTMILDAGAHLALSGRCLSPSDPAHLVLPSEYSSLGAGQPIAFGASIAQPDRTTVLALGDGGFMMTLADLDTAVRYGLRLIVLVMNNGGFAAEYMNLELDGDPTGPSVYANPDLAAVARALGADGITVARRDDLVKLGERLAHAAGPVVVDVKVPIDAENSWVGVSHRVHAGVPRAAAQA